MPSPKKMWEHPNPKNTRCYQFMQRINQAYNLNLKSYQELWQWSVDHIALFWKEAWDDLEVITHAPFNQVVDHEKKMPGAQWFKGAKLNFAENLLRFRDDHVAIYIKRENEKTQEVTYRQLFEQVEKTATIFKSLGVKKEDRVAGILPNGLEAVVAMLAATSIGAIWSGCSPDFGKDAILSRLSQIEPTLLIAVDAYITKGEEVPCLNTMLACQEDLKSLKNTLFVSCSGQPTKIDRPNTHDWQTLQNTTKSSPLTFESVPADHPLYILFSSGTTGQPKCIVHQTAGTLIQHLKEHVLHTDLKRSDTLFFYTTTSWMMWNWLVSGLAVGCSIVLFEGSPLYPRPDQCWKLVDEIGISHFGTSPKYLTVLKAKKIIPAQIANLSSLKMILTTGSPLSDEQFDFINEDIKQDCQIASIAGGTDIVSCFFLGNPLTPVYRGQLQARGLGMDVVSADENGKPIVGQAGELLCLSAAPSMPLCFWNDTDHQKYKQAYFSYIKGVWHHSDNITIYQSGAVKIWGRSDATLNPSGVRIGTAEIYQVLDQIPQIEDAVVAAQKEKNDEKILCFVILKENESLNLELRQTIKKELMEKCSKYHVPKKIIQTEEIPYTMNGKKMEVAVKKAINGEEVINKSTLANPKCLAFYEAWGKQPIVS